VPKRNPVVERVGLARGLGDDRNIFGVRYWFASFFSRRSSEKRVRPSCFAARLLL